MKFGFGPRIPGRLLGPLVELRATPPVYRPGNGGQYLPGNPELIEFYGAVLPLSGDDLRTLPQGTSSTDSKKVYTHGHELMVGSTIEDGNRNVYVVTTALEYDRINDLGRYIVKRKGAAGDKAATP